MIHKRKCVQHPYVVSRSGHTKIILTISGDGFTVKEHSKSFGFWKEYEPERGKISNDLVGAE